jgi:hypothetical protein
MKTKNCNHTTTVIELDSCIRGKIEIVKCKDCGVVVSAGIVR